MAMRSCVRHGGRRGRGRQYGSRAGERSIRSRSLAACPPTLIDWSKGADMIVVGCRGLGAIGRRLLGSVSSGLASPCTLSGRGHPRRGPDDAASVRWHPSWSVSMVRRLPRQATAIAFEEASRRGVDLVAVHAWSDFAVFELPGIEWSDSSRSKPTRRWPSGSPVGTNAIPTSPCDASCRRTGPHVSFSSSRSLRS